MHVRCKLQWGCCWVAPCSSGPQHFSHGCLADAWMHAPACLQMHVRAVVAVTSDLLVQEMTSVVTQLLGASSLSRQQGRGSSSGALSPDAQWPPRAPPTRPSRGEQQPGHLQQ
jgi:hypothetical protein